MELFISHYWIFFYVIAIIQLLFWFFGKRSGPEEIKDAAFKKLQRTYMAVYLLAMAGDWLQGPYVYALYDYYGMDRHQINELFGVGFGSSMIFGTIVGSLADKYGRKRNCQIYAVLYILSCITKHFPNYSILFIGRILGGISTSILFSSFESWVIFQHNKMGFSRETLSVLFSHATLGNSLVAIASGQLAQVFVGRFSYVVAFDLAMFFLTIMLVFVTITWEENYGDSTSDFTQTMLLAKTEILGNKKIVCLGLIQALFEGSMYVFVVNWTPALAQLDNPDNIPYGLVFSSYMVAVMVGSSIFKLFDGTAMIESYMRVVFVVAALTFGAPMFFPKNQWLVITGFLLFEICVGVFWPAMGTLRGTYVPEKVRSTVMNIFRIPLNLIVIIFLTQNLTQFATFTFCLCSLLLAGVVQHVLYSTRDTTPSDTPEV